MLCALHCRMAGKVSLLVSVTSMPSREVKRWRKIPAWQPMSMISIVAPLFVANAWKQVVDYINGSIDVIGLTPVVVPELGAINKELGWFNADVGPKVQLVAAYDNMLSNHMLTCYVVTPVFTAD